MKNFIDPVSEKAEGQNNSNFIVTIVRFNSVTLKVENLSKFLSYYY